MNRPFDAHTVRALLDELVRRLGERGVRGGIRIAGGAAMLLRFPNDPAVRVTRDIDALVEPADEVLAVVAEMADELGLLPGWLNSAGSGWFRVDVAASDDEVHVAVATARELVAMKLAAGRDKDFADLVVLARHLGITHPEELVRIAYDVYGNDAVELPDGRDSYLWYAESVIAEVNRAN
ncbi:hypothetical protein [Agromyces aerolatus]|uniref:hypothetical protein n=1 Tax=Agromyces sp. LY-1074 TaxID=3074080 RepID=UPI00285CB7FB|nr:MULTISPECIES: hypothetical protein [unclassified Agromyces]MDR5699627.1 hypothetical protein [Agromyces sp. LY-1074]MDR5705923.1 hypothetical protein [Agromyces sp. LY-1358]